MSTIPDESNLGIVLPASIAEHIYINLEHNNETSIRIALVACGRPCSIGLPSFGKYPSRKPESVLIIAMMMSTTGYTGEHQCQWVRHNWPVLLALWELKGNLRVMVA
jgi:hypothetical protein